MLFLNWHFRCNRTKYLKAVYHPKNLSRARGLNGMAFPQISLFNHCECTVCLNTIFPPVSRLKRTNCCYLHRKKIESVWIVVDFSFFCTAQSMWFHHGIHPQRFFFYWIILKEGFFVLYCCCCGNLKLSDIHHNRAYNFDIQLFCFITIWLSRLTSRKSKRLALCDANFYWDVRRLMNDF